MNDFKLKVILAALTGVIFSFIFIVLAFALPSKKQIVIEKKAKNRLEVISKSLRE